MKTDPPGRSLGNQNQALTGRLAAQVLGANRDESGPMSHANQHNLVLHTKNGGESREICREKIKPLIKGACISISYDIIWRRERDSNPRYAINVYTLSRRAP